MQREIILACSCCRLGFCDEGGAYIVPLNFGYEERGGKRTFYFHGAREGRKMELIKAGGPVGFEHPPLSRVSVPANRSEKPAASAVSWKPSEEAMAHIG